MHITPSLRGRGRGWGYLFLSLYSTVSITSSKSLYLVN